MMASKFDLQEFVRRPDAVAAQVRASDVFGLLTRTLDLPPRWAALVRRNVGDHVVVPDGGVVSGDDADEVLFVRTSPIDVDLSEEVVVTHDRFQCQARVHLRLRLIPDRSELCSFQGTLVGSRSTLMCADIARYVQPALRAALTRFAGDRAVAELVDGEAADAVSAAMLEAVKGLCFASGLAVDGAPSVQFQSQALRRVRQTQQETVRRRAEHEGRRTLEEGIERAQAEHLDHLSSLLERLKGLADSSPEVALPELVQTFTERQRGEIYQALFACERAESKTRQVVVAAGDELLFFDTNNLEEPTRRVPMTGKAGPVRSVQTIDCPGAAPVLLLGAATGVYRFSIDQSAPDLTLLVGDVPRVRGGFNAATAVGDRVFASHSELGLCEWHTGEPGSARFRFESMTRGAQAVRGVVLFDGNLYASIDSRVIRWPVDAAEESPAGVYTGSEATITALCPTEDGLFAGNAAGEVLHWPAGRQTAPECLHRGGNRAVESLWLLSSHGVRRIVFTDTSVRVHARVLGDNFTCHYEAGGQTLRRVEVAPDLIVATNDLRDRLICWTPGKPAKPSTIIGVARLCGHSLQDVCLVPRA